MAGVTLEQAEKRLQQYLDAEEKVLNGQSYSIGERKMTRADLAEIRQGIQYWENKVARLSRGGGARVRGIRPIG
jgi:hypothetical protein